MLFALEETSLSVEVQYAKNGEEVLEILHLSPAHVDNDTYPRLVMLDLELPRIHGLDVLKKIRQVESTRTLPVIIFSSSFDEGSIRQCYELGANSFIQKPIDFFDFGRIMEGIIRFWITDC